MTDTEKLRMLKLAVDHFLHQPAIDKIYRSDRELEQLSTSFPAIAGALTALGHALLELHQVYYSL